MLFLHHIITNLVYHVPLDILLKFKGYLHFHFKRFIRCMRHHLLHFTFISIFNILFQFNSSFLENLLKFKFNWFVLLIFRFTINLFNFLVFINIQFTESVLVITLRLRHDTIHQFHVMYRRLKY